MSNFDQDLADAFVCPECAHHDAQAERLSMSGTEISRLFKVQPYSYSFGSCDNYGYTEILNLKTLEGKDDLGTFLEILFAN